MSGRRQNELSISEARDGLADIVNAAAYGGVVTYVTRRGRRLAAVIPAELMEAIEAAEDTADVAAARAAIAEPGPNVSHGDVLADDQGRRDPHHHRDQTIAAPSADGFGGFSGPSPSGLATDV
ncbi:MAG TPA: type II toxin-antitoxin system prevent-host-death family antitoxin [Streptosporangiaceae bacterium]|jgi:prevent-host-death family protein